MGRALTFVKGQTVQTNRPHYHVWIFATSRDAPRMAYRLARAFHTRQAAQQWAKRDGRGNGFQVLKCHHFRCRPRLS